MPLLPSGMQFVLQPTIGILVTLFASTRIWAWSSHDYAMVPSLGQPFVSETAGAELANRRVIASGVVVGWVFAAVVPAIAVMAFPHVPAHTPPATSLLAKCECQFILGSTVLVPTYQVLLSSLWLTVQAVATSIGVNLLKHGTKGAAVLREVDREFGVTVVNSAANVSPFLWKPILVMQIGHFFVMLAQRIHSGLDATTVFHEVYFAYVASGAISFVVFSTLGSLACEALIASECHQAAYQMSLEQAGEYMREFDQNQDGLIDFEEFNNLFKAKDIATEVQWSQFVAYCKSANADPIGLDVAGLRKACAFDVPFYNASQAEQMREATQGRQDDFLMATVPGMLVVGDPKYNRNVYDSRMKGVLMMSTAPQDGVQAWACFNTNGTTSRLFMNQAEGNWIFDHGPGCGWAGLMPRIEKSPPATMGELPEEVWPHMVRTACVADLRCALNRSGPLMQANAEKGAGPRHDRSKFVTMIMLLLCPVSATHIFPGAIQYAFIIMPLLAIAGFTVAAAVGWGESFEDLHWECPEEFGDAYGNTADYDQIIEGGGDFNGYDVPLPGPMMSIYRRAAEYLRRCPLMVRVVIMNLGLTLLTLVAQFSFNYALLRYLGYSFWEIPYIEFKSRTMSCQVCTVERSARNAALAVSWLI